MYLPNTLAEHGRPLDPRDRALLGRDGADAVARFLALRAETAATRLRAETATTRLRAETAATPARAETAATPLRALPGLARAIGVGAVHLKDEGGRLGLGSFKALGGAYALMRLVQAEAERRLARAVPPEALLSPEVRAIAATMTFACATDGNHGRSVAQGAQLMGARAVIFVHGGVSDGRIAAMARLGATIRRVAGTYDDSVAASARVAGQRGWTLLSDTSWPGYEHIPGLVMQGYTAIAREALAALDAPPTHVFLQAGVGGFAAAVAGHLALLLGEARPHVTVVEPARAACLLAGARAGRPVRVAETEPTVMAMLECYEASLVAFRVLARVADGFMTVDEDDALAIMRRLAAPVPGDPPVVAGESGAVGLAGAVALLREPGLAAAIGLGPAARLLVVNTEGATDPVVYERIVGRAPDAVAEPAQRGG